MRIVKTCAVVLIAASAITVAVRSISSVTAQTTAFSVRTNEYKVVERSSPDALGTAVTDALRAGWQPVGGVSVNDGRYFQAIGR